MYKAWETASKERQYDYYIWLNDDTFTYPEMISTLLSASQKKEDKAIIVGPTTDAQHIQPTYGGRLNNGKIPIPNGILTSVTHFNGNIVLIPQSVYKVLGNLDYYFTHSKGNCVTLLYHLQNGGICYIVPMECHLKKLFILNTVIMD